MRSLTEFEVAGKRYRTGRLDAFKQFAIVRRLGKVSGAFAAALTAWQSRREADAFAIVEPFLRALGEIPEEDVRLIISTALNVVTRQEPTGWQRITSPAGDVMYADISDSLLVTGQIVWNVLQDSLADFFTELLSGLAALGTETAKNGSTSPEAKTG
jgi:hypothetical protein